MQVQPIPKTKKFVFFANFVYTPKSSAYMTPNITYRLLTADEHAEPEI
jgi:hypothetical protein